MRCYHTYDEKIGKVLIPGCWPVVNSNDISDCTCKDYNMTFKEFDKQKYNAKVNELMQEVEILKKENIHLLKLLENKPKEREGK